MKNITNGGIYYAMTGRYDNALKDFNIVMSLKPDLAMAYYNRGLVYKKLGDDRKVEAGFRKAKHLGW